MLVNRITQFYWSDTLRSLERAADSISILEMAEHSKISVLMPHSDASAHHSMVST
jgi:hypothetical protein